MKKTYALMTKINTVWMLRDKSIKEASLATGISTRRIRKWEKEYDQLWAAYEKYMGDEAWRNTLIAQNRATDKLLVIINAMTEDKISKAPLNQLSSAFGVIVDRFIRIEDVKNKGKADNQRVIRVEYYDATTGKVSETPPWAEDDLTEQSPFHRRLLRQAFRENGTGKADDNGTGATRSDDVVARTYVSDGKSRMARPEDDDDERDWYPD